MATISFEQNGQRTKSIDAGQPAISVPLRTADYVANSVQLVGDATVAGKADFLISNADIRKDALDGDPMWVTVDDLSLTVAAGELPAFMRNLFNDVDWIAIRWTPNGGSGQLAARLGGPRR